MKKEKLFKKILEKQSPKHELPDDGSKDVSDSPSASGNMPEDSELNVNDERISSCATATLPKERALDAEDARVRSAAAPVPHPKEETLNVHDVRVRSVDTESMTEDAVLNVPDKRDAESPSATVSRNIQENNNEDALTQNPQEKHRADDIPASDVLHISVVKNIPYHLSQDVLKRVEVIGDLRAKTLYLYDDTDGYFHALNDLEFWAWLNANMRSYAEKLTTSIVKEAYNKLLVAPGVQMTMDEMDPEQDFVNCQNCVVNVKTGKQYEHTPAFLFINCLAGNYIGKDAPVPNKYLKWLSALLPETEEQVLLFSIIGYMLSNHYTAKKFFYFFGASNSGKSEILHLVDKLVGEHVAAHIAIEDLSEKHTAGELYGKKINTCAESNPGKVIKKTRILKALTGGDIIDANPKLKSHFQFSGKTKIMQAANPEPGVAPEANDDAFWNRIVPIEFSVAVPEGSRIINFAEALLAREADLIVSYHLNTMRKNLKEGTFRFSLPESTRILIERLRRNCDSVRLFAETEGVFESEAKISKQALTNRYFQFCENYRLPPVSKGQVVKRLLKLYPQLNDENVRVHESRDTNPLAGVQGIRLREV